MRRLRRKFKRPRLGWDETLIAEEKKILKKFGLRRKRELRRSEAMLRNFRRRARELIAVTDKEKEKVLLDKIKKLGFLPQEKNELDDVLALDISDILERRLQTLVFKKGMSKTIKQARQLIVHGKILIGDRRVTNPSYIVKTDEEDKISMRGDSNA